MLKINVKWQKQVFKDIEVDTSQPAMVLKMQVYSLTAVSPERQKLMAKGKKLQDDDDLSEKLKDGMTLMMMGTPEENIVKAPEKAQVFLEDLPPEQQNLALSVVPAGLENVGNTCYLNATLQCLRIVPELSQKLKDFTPPQSREPNAMLVASLKDLYHNLEVIGNATDPTFFNMVFRSVHAQFQEMERGVHKQQDADEAWSAVLASAAACLQGQAQGSNLIDELFGIRFKHTLKCTEAMEEEPVVNLETTRKLSCHISIDVNYLLDGVKMALSEHITKRSPSLERDAVYEKRTTVERLPPWLTVNFMRFFYKAEQQAKAKILRPVKFPRNLDLIELCSEDTQRTLRRLRARAAKKRDLEKEERDKQELAEEAAKAGSAAPEGEGGEQPEPLEDDDDEQELVDPGFSAQYELKAVLTHIGRTLDGGHYIAWVHKSGDDWLKFDDKVVTPCKYEEDILKLAGGGDWHTAYLCLYQERKV